MAASNQGRPDQPTASKNGLLPVTYTLATTLKRAKHDPLNTQGAEVLKALATAEPRPGTMARCLNPTCDEQCAWTDTSGRPRKFCSDTCRQQHEHTRKRLEHEIAILDGALAHPATTPTEKKVLRSHRAHRLFQLTRYPDVRGPRTKSVIRKPSTDAHP